MLIVGSGLAGLALARELNGARQEVRVLDKGRRAGGRIATRRWEGRILDHGAQFFTARGERLEALCFGWLAEGWLRIWTRGFGQYRDGQFAGLREDGHARYAPSIGMNFVGQTLSRGLDVQQGTRIVRVEHTAGLWTLEDASGRRYQDAQVVFNLPAPQVVDLLRGVVDTSSLEPVRLSPTFTLMLALEQDLDVPWKAAQSEHHPVGWISRDHTKRDGDAPPTLVIHASGEWSGEHLEHDALEVARELLAHTEQLLGTRLGVQFQRLHRWRYATPEVFYPDACHWDPALGLGWCGDWCGTARVEGALESGWALAGRVLGVEQGTEMVPEGARGAKVGARE